MIFHKHEWKEFKRVFVPPIRLGELQGVGEEVLKQILFGITSIELRCIKCGDISSKVILGDMVEKK